MSLDNEKSMECQYEDDDDFFTCQIIHEKRLNDFLVEPDFSLDDLEVDIEAEKKNKKKTSEKKDKKGKDKNYITPENFVPFQHEYPLHSATPTLPRRFHDIEPSPYSIFRLFFTEDQLQTIVQSTNLYAYRKKTDQTNWNDLTLNELKIWLALVIYMGVFKLPAVRDYWVIDSYFPSHEVTKLMTIKRFNEVFKI